MASQYGDRIKVQIFGQSHSVAIGAVVDGLPAGIKIDFDALGDFLKRRAPGQSELSTARKEADKPEFISGLSGENGDTTCGAPLTIIIRNSDARSSDYAELRDIPRPSHADYAAQSKYGGFQDVAGGGHFSGRLTAPLCAAGGICLQVLQSRGINITATILSPTEEEMLQAKKDGDSIGGIIECIATGVPAGLGDPIFDGMENRIAKIIFGIPAVKGIEFGAGFAGTNLRGSENNDSFYIDNTSGEPAVKTRTNNCGGILGGITNGMPIVFRVAVKPTPSIAKEQQSVSLSRMENTTLQIKGRHDPCIVLRALPCVEAATAIAVYDALLGGDRL